MRVCVCVCVRACSQYAFFGNCLCALRRGKSHAPRSILQCTHTHTQHIHTRTHTYTRTHTHTNTHTCTHARTHACTHARTQASKQTSKQASKHTYMHVQCLLFRAQSGCLSQLILLHQLRAVDLCSKTSHLLTCSIYY